jgi:hypothetical protein
LPPILWQKDFNRVVNSHDAENFSGLINDRKSQQVVLSDFLGHLDCIVIDATNVPALPGALEYVWQGHVTGGGNRNRRGLEGKVEFPSPLSEDVEHLLFDPQTSGGLLLLTPPEVLSALLADLPEAVVIGRARPLAAAAICVIG